MKGNAKLDTENVKNLRKRVGLKYIIIVKQTREGYCSHARAAVGISNPQNERLCDSALA